MHLDSFEGTDGSIRLSDIHLQQLSFDLVLGLSVQIEKDVKIEVEGSFCYPRPEVISTSSGFSPIEYPPQCEAIFLEDLIVILMKVTSKVTLKVTLINWITSEENISPPFFIVYKLCIHINKTAVSSSVLQSWFIAQQERRLVDES